MSGIVDSDWSNTTRWGVQAFDADGNDITADAGLVFGSGAAYPTFVSPEPASVTLIGTGLVLLTIAGRFRRRRTDTGAPLA
jgi:hypothetical protein